MAITIIIEVEDKTEDGAAEALVLIAKQIRKGFRSGADKNSDGKYNYEVTGDPEDETEKEEE